MCLKTAAPTIRNTWPQPNTVSGRLNEVGVPAFPVHDFHQRKDTLRGRSNSSVGPTYPQARGLGVNPQRWVRKKDAGHTALVIVSKP